MKAKVTATFVAVYGLAAILVFANSANLFQRIPGFASTPAPTSTQTPESTTSTTPWQQFEPPARKLEFHTLTGSPTSTNDSLPEGSATPTTATPTSTGTLGGGIIRQPSASTTD